MAFLFQNMNNVNCRRDMTEILLKAAQNTIQTKPLISVHDDANNR